MRTSASIGLVLACFAWSVLQATVVADDLSESEVKAAFLVNFGKFVEWPPAAFGDSPSFIIGVVGDDPFGSDLDDAVRGKSINGRAIVVRRVDWQGNMSRFQIVFVSASEKRRVGDILRRLGGFSVLTVSDMDGFCEAGGTIAFVAVDRRIRFQIDPQEAQKRNLRISARLLSLALIYTRR